MLREQRIKKGMTLDALAKASGVSRVSINRYELGTRTPDVVAAKKIADALGCRIEDLIPPIKAAPQNARRADYGT